MLFNYVWCISLCIGIGLFLCVITYVNRIHGGDCREGMKVNEYLHSRSGTSLVVWRYSFSFIPFYILSYVLEGYSGSVNVLFILCIYGDITLFSIRSDIEILYYLPCFKNAYKYFTVFSRSGYGAWTAN